MDTTYYYLDYKTASRMLELDNDFYLFDCLSLLILLSLSNLERSNLDLFYNPLPTTYLLHPGIG